MEKHLSWHFLRRRAEARRSQIRDWQRDAKPNGGSVLPEPDALSPTNAGSITKAAALKRLEALGIAPDWRIVVRKRGKYDARYDVIATSPS